MVRDFQTWPKWSPWLCAEPGCGQEVSADGKENSWDGEVVGSGSMKIVGEQENHSIEYELTLAKPWKSVSKVSFLFGREGERTRITWRMNGKLPFLFFWMEGMLKAGVGSDYQRGLAMLKDYLQLGEIPSDLNFMGEGDFEGLSFVGIKTNCRIADVGEKMEADMARLQKWIQDQNITPSGKPISIYHKWNLTHGSTLYTIGFPVEKIPGWLPEGFDSGTIPQCRVQRIQHTGSYRHLANAWSSGMAQLRAKKWQAARGIPPFEIYENDPTEVAESEIVTTVHFPAK